MKQMRSGWEKSVCFESTKLFGKTFDLSNRQDDWADSIAVIEFRRRRKPRRLLLGRNDHIQIGITNDVGSVDSVQYNQPQKFSFAYEVTFNLIQMGALGRNKRKSHDFVVVLPMLCKSANYLYCLADVEPPIWKLQQVDAAPQLT